MALFGKRKRTTTTTTTAQREQRREAAAKASREFDDELDEMILTGSAITQRADTVLAKIMAGTATQNEINGALDSDLTNPYASIDGVIAGCFLYGIEPTTGRPGIAAMVFLEGVYAGLGEADALTRALVSPAALQLWMQDAEFRSALAEA